MCLPGAICGASWSCPCLGLYLDAQGGACRPHRPPGHRALGTGVRGQSRRRTALRPVGISGRTENWILKPFARTVRRLLTQAFSPTGQPTERCCFHGKLKLSHPGLRGLNT